MKRRILTLAVLTTMVSCIASSVRAARLEVSTGDPVEI